MTTMTYQTIAQRAARAQRIATESGSTLYEAARALGIADLRQADQHADRYEGLACHLTSEQTIPTEADALSAGVNYVRAWQQDAAEQRKAHAWNTIGHVESDQPYALLHALAGAQSFTDEQGTEHYLPLSKYGRPMRIGERAKRQAVGKAHGRKAQGTDGKALSGAERAERSRALSKWRKAATQAGYVCPTHGPIAEQTSKAQGGQGKCATECRVRALGLTEQAPDSVKVAESAGRGW